MQIPILLYVFLSRAALSVPLPQPGFEEIVGTLAKCFGKCGMGSPTASEQALVAAEEGLAHPHPEIAGYLHRDAVRGPMRWNRDIQQQMDRALTNGQAGQTIKKRPAVRPNDPIWDWEQPAKSQKVTTAPSPANPPKQPMQSNLDPQTVPLNEKEVVIPNMMPRGATDGSENLFLNEVRADIDPKTSQPIGLPSRTQIIPAGSKLPVAGERIGEWVPNPNFGKPGHEGEGVMVMMNKKGELVGTGRISDQLATDRAPPNKKDEDFLKQELELFN